MADFRINVAVDVKGATVMLTDLARRQVPYATAVAINDLAFQVQRAERAAIQSAFRHPRPFTVNSVVVDKATKAFPAAIVSIRPEVAKYLLPYEVGGVHALPGKALLNPKNIRLDQYGQLRRQSPAQAVPPGSDIFEGTVMSKAGPVVGFWRRLRQRGGQRGLRLLVRFGDALPVNLHLNFHVRARAVVAANFRAAFDKALSKAIASAR